MEYFDDLRDTIINGDSLEELPKFPSNSIDMIFADPPYFGAQSNLTLNRYDGYSNNIFSTGKAKWALKKSLDYQFDFHYIWLRECKRILKKGCTIWISGTYHSIGVINVLLQELKYKILNEIILVKKNASPNFSGSCFRAITENLLWAKKGKSGRAKFNYKFMKQLNGGIQMNNVWEYNAKKNDFRHPATKQESILEKVVLSSTNESDLILDPFGGSGTTAVVAKKLGRNYIIIEKEKEYCDLISKRISAVQERKIIPNQQSIVF